MSRKVLLCLLFWTLTNAKTLGQRNLHHETRRQIEQLNSSDVDDTEDYELHDLLSQVIPKGLENFQAELQNLKNMLKNANAKLPQFEKNSKLSFGGTPDAGKPKILFGNITVYVDKTINHVKLELQKTAGSVLVNNSPYVIYKIPHTPIVFKLKYMQGLPSIGARGTSSGLHYFEKTYGFIQYKFNELKYYYDVEIIPYNLFPIRKSITIIIKDAAIWNHVSLEENQLQLYRFEFIFKPKVSVDCGAGRLTNYAIDYVVNEQYPEIRQKLIEIASRDTKLFIQAHLKNVQ